MMANLHRESDTEATTFQTESGEQPRLFDRLEQAGGQLADASVVVDTALRCGRVVVTVELKSTICVTLGPLFLGAEAFVYAFGGVEINFELIVEVGVVWFAVFKLFVSVDGGHEINSEREI